MKQSNWILLILAITVVIVTIIMIHCNRATQQHTDWDSLLKRNLLTCEDTKRRNKWLATNKGPYEVNHPQYYDFKYLSWMFSDFFCTFPAENLLAKKIQRYNLKCIN